jgi:oligosaccharide repeat unit polymerase
MIASIANPLGLFLLVWGTVMVLYAGGVYSGMFPSPEVLTVGAVLLNAVTFSLGYLTWILFRGLDREPSVPAPAFDRPAAAETLTAPLRLALAAGMVALALEMYRIMLIARHFETTWHHLVIHPDVFRLRLVAFIGDNIFQASGTVMLLSVTNSLFSIGFVLLGVFLHLDRTGRRYVYLCAFLGLGLFIGVIRLSRQEMTANALFLVFAYCFLYAEPLRRARSRRLWGVWFPAAAVAMLFGLVDILLQKSGTYDRPNPLQGFLFQIYWYIASPLAAFNEFVLAFTGDHQWGQNTFFPLYKWLCRLGLARQTEVSVYGQMLFIPYATNVYTYLRSFYEDFGILGIAVAPYLLGWATAAVRARAHRDFQFLNLYVILLVVILFSFFNYFLFSSQIYLQILFGFVLFRYELPDGGDPGRSFQERVRTA